MALKILSLIDAFRPTSYGGAGKVFIESSKALVDEGHFVDAICRSVDDIPEDLFEGIKFYTYRDIAGGQVKKIKHYRKEIKRFFITQIENKKPDFIIVHSSSAVFGLKKILKYLNVPIIYYFHSPWNKEYEILAREKGITFCGGQCPIVSVLSAIRKRHERKYLQLASGIVNLSKSMQEIMLEVHPSVKNIPKEIISGGANPKIFFPALDEKEKIHIRGKLKLPKDDFLIISSRRLVPRTGVDVLIDTFAQVLKEHSTSNLEPRTSNKGIKLILTGSGVAEENLKQQAEDLKIADNIIFTGYVAENRLADYYRCSDLFVMPTKELEGFGLSTVEAMASGLPVIGTDIGGTPEILAKVDENLIIPECSVEAIAGKMSEFIVKPEAEQKELGVESAKCAAENFTWGKHVDKLLNFYKCSI